MILLKPLWKRCVGKTAILLAFFGCAAFAVHAQELNCSVTINATQIQTSDAGIFRDLENSIEQFMNSRKWTNDVFRQHEKIDCAFLINITKMPAVGTFEASVQIQSARPIFNTNYSSPLLNFADREWKFDYIESTPLEYNDNAYTNNLTSMLALYAYLILGLDYDSFSDLGGTTFFQRALMVVNNAQNSNQPGWQALGSNRSRYWLVEALNNPQNQALRKTYYTYHRLGLDTFDQDADKARTVILEGLREVKKVRDINPNSILIVSFLDAKGRELANVFSDGNIQVRREAYDIITAMDPSNRSAYEKILQN